MSSTLAPMLGEAVRVWISCTRQDPGICAFSRTSERVHLPETFVRGKSYFVKLSSVFEVRRTSEDF